MALPRGQLHTMTALTLHAPEAAADYLEQMEVQIVMEWTRGLPVKEARGLAHQGFLAPTVR